jgi:DNA-binding XRE family transcriptional regulator/ribosomal protein L37E
VETHVLNRWKEWRNAGGISQADAAMRVGASRSVIANWESGRTRPRPEVMERICALLEIEVPVNQPRRITCDIECPECRRLTPSIDGHARHCLWCGARLVRTCGRCQHVMHDPDDAFCSRCGYPLSAEQEEFEGPPATNDRIQPDPAGAPTTLQPAVAA